MRKLFLFVAFALIVAACGGDAEPASSAVPSTQAETMESAPPSTAATNSPEPGEGSPAETAPPTEPTEASAPSYDGPAAPDFELALADGSTFRLSDEQKPVYIVFWAEW